MNKSSKSLLLAAALSLSLSACGDKKTTAADADKVAVKVNGQAISVAEFNVKARHGADDSSQAIPEAMVKQFVDMELLRQAAVKAKLDSDPTVRARIAIATRTMMATAYMEQQLAAVAKPTEAEIAAYYNQNPARFAERKQYGFQEFSIQPPDGKAPEIHAQLANSKTYADFEQWLTRNKIPHGSTPVSVTSDRLPDEVLRKLTQVTVGGHVVVGDAAQMNVVFVLAEQAQPIALAQEAPAIANMLMEKRKRETLDNTVKQLRDQAKIDYVPPFTASGFTPPADKQ